MLHYLAGDCRRILPTLPPQSAHCCVTSPPYWGLRDYGVAGQLGHERTPEEYVQKLVAVFRHVRRVLRDDGTLWLNLGDTYASAWSCSRRNLVGQGAAPLSQRVNRLSGWLKEKDLIGIPWRVAFALQQDGWYLRSDIVWHKPNAMPESVADRPARSHEYVFLLAKRERYYYDAGAVREPHTMQPQRRRTQRHSRRDAQIAALRSDKLYAFALREEPGVDGNPAGRSKRTVWSVATRPSGCAHLATFPPELVRPCIRAGCPPNGTVLDPFAGAGTTGLVAAEEGRNALLIELNPAYLELARERVRRACGTAG